MLQLIGVIAVWLIVYTICINMAVDNTGRKKIRLNKILKYIFGFFVYGSDQFEIKSVVMQSGNIIGILVSVVYMLEGTIDKAFRVYSTILIVTFIISTLIAIFNARRD